ncbi:MAG TPA: methyltransferase domain-containing protein [Pyrinomonadaceae bacterium]|nr:methyltransferase domain-containing protein [Pyrinomonadaceae bacterium]
MNENIEFLHAFLKNPTKVGSITPSSPELALEMLKGVKPDADNVVIELGVGTGAITKFLQELVPDERSYLGIELDEALVRVVGKSFPNLNIVCGNAADMCQIYEQSGLGKISYIISCLPFVSLPADIRDAVLDEVDKFMQQGCIFRTLQYAHGYYLPSAIKFRKLMQERFGKEKRSPLVVKNVPPGYLLTWATN